MSEVSVPISNLISDEYTPGVCNIGPEELARRRQSMYFGIAGLIIITAGFFVRSSFLPETTVVDVLSYLVIFIVAFGTGISFLQVRMKFCVAFGVMAVQNFGKLGESDKVQDDEARKKDRAKVIQMTLYAIGFSVLYTTAAFALDLVL